MDIQTLDAIREIFHNGSIALLIFGIGLAIAGLWKPRALGKVFHEFSRRRYIVLTAIFVCLLSGTVFTATESTPQPLHSNAPRPITHTTDTDGLNDLEEESLPESAVQATKSQLSPDPQPVSSQSAATGQTRVNPSQPVPAPTSPQSPTQTSKQPVLESGDKQQTTKKDCRIELLWLCF
jgi:hypothetical protein